MVLSGTQFLVSIVYIRKFGHWKKVVVIILKFELQATLFISKSRGPDKILRVISSLR